MSSQFTRRNISMSTFYILEGPRQLGADVHMKINKPRSVLMELTDLSVIIVKHKVLS